MQLSRTIREGTLGLFAILGLIVFGILTVWIKGGGFGPKGYQFLVSFSDVGGLQLGAPVNFRGVTVGKLVRLQANSQQVNATLEIASPQLRIPKSSHIETSRYGLVGEASIDITPPAEPLPEAAENISPLGDDCPGNGLIICQNDEIKGKSGSQLLATMSKLAEAYSNPEFVRDINQVTENAAITLQKMGKLSDDLSLTLKTTQRDIARLSQQLAQTSQSFEKTAENASQLLTSTNQVVTTNQDSIRQTLSEASQLTNNLNRLLDNNQSQITSTLQNFNTTSVELTKLARNFNHTTTSINQALDTADTKVLAEDLKTLIASANTTMANLKAISTTINDPATLVTLQKTLDAARATMENTEKITADVDEVLGDPQFRQNLKRVIEGLSQLLSTTQQLEQQLQTAENLEFIAQSQLTTADGERMTPPRSLTPQVKIIPQK